MSKDYTQAGRERDQVACEEDHMAWMLFARVNAPQPPTTRNQIEVTVLRRLKLRRQPGYPRAH